MHQLVNSKEVAEVLGKRHDNFLRDIRKYIATLGDEAPKYFAEGTYTDGTGKARAGYEITLAGCELIAGRMIGEKGDPFREFIVRTFYKAPPNPVQEEPVSVDLTVDEVAKRLGCSERNVYRMIKAGKLQAIQKEILIPTTRTFVTEDALENYVEECRGKK